jgi:uncharacterized membrane protein
LPTNGLPFASPIAGFGESPSHRPVPPKPNSSDQKTHLEEDICVHIFTVSAAMVGVCLTVIGIIRIVITIRNADTFADDLLALDAVLFLISCLCSYFALRTRSIRRMHNVERFADVVFVVALIVMVIVCVVITYAISFA